MRRFDAYSFGAFLPGAGQDQDCVLGNLRLNPEALSAKVDGSPLSLTVQEFELLLVLARHAGRILRQEEIAAFLWGHWLPKQRRHLGVLIARLRHKLRGCDPYRIETIRKRGYGLMPAPTSEIE